MSNRRGFLSYIVATLVFPWAEIGFKSKAIKAGVKLTCVTHFPVSKGKNNFLIDKSSWENEIEREEIFNFFRAQGSVVFENFELRENSAKWIITFRSLKEYEDIFNELNARNIFNDEIRRHLDYRITWHLKTETGQHLIAIDERVQKFVG